VVLSQEGVNLIRVVATDYAGNETVVEEEVFVASSSITAKIIIDPSTVNVKSTSRNAMITMYIALPNEEDLYKIDIHSITLNNVTKPITDSQFGYVKNPVVENKKHEGFVFMIKFREEEFIKAYPDLLDGTSVIRGSLTDGKTFIGKSKVELIK
jgi:hypothetical protein